ncbi:hypothetical protein GBAR_LOCUS16582 [Geodia barretti]|uniref:Uncharacterized protein n=1 Tax=Geodia barretti TaxID=519541 RepID=A0AA35WWI3_GEOBA|nr:hypothetical protein GBAR_LOCUS16582 [Geodia barretti]
MPLTRVGKWAVVYGVVAVEMAAITGSYLQWKKLNSSQDYRKWMRDHHPKALDGSVLLDVYSGRSPRCQGERSERLEELLVCVGGLPSHHHHHNMTAMT